MSTPPINSEPVLNPTNLGGVIKIQIVLAKHAHVSRPNSNNEVTLSLSSVLQDISFIMETALLTEVHKYIPEGSIFEVNAQWSSARVTQDTFQSAHEFLEREVVILLTSPNGTKYLIGDEVVPAFISINKNVPKKVAELNAHHFKVIYRSPLAIRFVT